MQLVDVTKEVLVLIVNHSLPGDLDIQVHIDFPLVLALKDDLSAGRLLDLFIDMVRVVLDDLFAA